MPKIKVFRHEYNQISGQWPVFATTEWSRRHGKQALVLPIHAELRQATLWTVSIPPCWPCWSLISWEKLETGARETAELHQILSFYASGTRGVNGEKQLKGTCFVRDCLYRLNLMIIRNGMWHCGPWDSAICSMKGALFMPLKWHISCFFHRDSTGLFSLPTEPSHATHHGCWQSGNN